MKNYIGVKQVKAKPMTREAYNAYRGWSVPEDENPKDPGYLIRYPDGYISWSPDKQFVDAYRQTHLLSYGLAIEAAKLGHAIARQGWNGKNMFVVLMPALSLPPFNTTDTQRKVNDRTAKWIGEDAPLDCQPYFAMYTADKKWQPGWLVTPLERTDESAKAMRVLLPRSRL